MAPTTSVQSTASLADDARVARRGRRPPKPYEKIWDVRATLGLKTRASTTTLRTIFPSITVVLPADQQEHEEVNAKDRAETRRVTEDQQPEW